MAILEIIVSMSKIPQDGFRIEGEEGIGLINWNFSFKTLGDRNPTNCAGHRSLLATSTFWKMMARRDSSDSDSSCFLATSTFRKMMARRKKENIRDEIDNLRIMKNSL